MTKLLGFDFLKNLWDEWELRGIILISLFLQSFLILAAPLRKRTYSSWVILPIWSAYLLADCAASFAVGLISNSQNSKYNNSNGKCPRGGTGSGAVNNPDLLAFWAPFLLVHLGGPDTITAFALEDNELWLRHLLALIFQASAAAYVLYQTLPGNELLIPTICMFMSGLIKYSERTVSLFRASLNQFRDSMLKDPNPGLDYANSMNEYRSMREAKLPKRIVRIEERPERWKQATDRVKKGRLDDREAVLFAHRFFETFKGLIVDLIFSSRDRSKSRDFFLERVPEDAFKVITLELNFMYDVLFTKVCVLYTFWGYLGRFVASCMVVASFALFFRLDKHGFSTPDVAITYALLYGAMVLDVIAFVKLVTSNWILVHIRKLPDVHLEAARKEPAPPSALLRKLSGYWVVRFLRRGWSESVAKYNLINYCLNRRRPVKEKLIELFNLKTTFDGIKYVSYKEFGDGLRDHIFEELKMKSDVAGDDLEKAKEASEARGDWALRGEPGCGHLLPYVRDMDYDRSLLLWHIATEICWCVEKDDELAKKKDQQSITDPEPEHEHEHEHERAGDDDGGGGRESPRDAREFSKLLSDYMMYLLIMQQTMMSAVAGIGQIRFRDTCEEAEKLFIKNRELRKPAAVKVIAYALSFFGIYFIRGLLAPVLSFVLSFLFSLFVTLLRPLLPSKTVEKLEKWAKRNKYCKKLINYLWWEEEERWEEEELDPRQVTACRAILDVNTEVEPVSIKGDRSNSVLFEGCRLAKELIKLEGRKWEIMSRVWIEMLSYAAVRCRPHSHAQQLGKGGELLTLVWLLMTHLGLGEEMRNFRSVQGTQGQSLSSISSFPLRLPIRP